MRRRRTGGEDEGFTIVEMVVTIMIVATVVIPMLNAVITGIRSSSTSRSIAQVETVLQNAADRVNRAPKRCDYTVYVQAAAQYQGWAAGQASAQHQHYVPGATPAQAGTWVAGACEGSTPDDLLVQMVTITVSSPDGHVRRTIQVVKSDV